MAEQQHQSGIPKDPVESSSHKDAAADCSFTRTAACVLQQVMSKSSGKGWEDPTCVYAVQRRICGGVAEAYAAIGSATAAGQQAVLMWRPGDGLHSSRMVPEAQDG